VAWDLFYYKAFAYSFEEDDKDAFTISQLVGVVNVTRQTSRVQTGAAGGDFDYSVNGNRPVLRTGALGELTDTTADRQVILRRGYFGLDVAPTSEAALLYISTDSTGVSGGTKLLCFGTDRKLRWYDKNGNQVGDASTTLLPTAGLQELTITINKATLSTVWLSLKFGTGASEELAFDTGLTVTQMFATLGYLFWGEALGAGVNRGCHLYVDDLTSRNGAVAESPHLVAYPRLNIYGSVNPTGVGFYSAWDSMTNNTVDNVSSLASYVDDGELPTHDGDTSHLQSTTNNEKFTLVSTVANPLPDPFTIAWVAINAVLRLTGAGKIAPGAMLRLAGTDDFGTIGASSASFAGAQDVFPTKPGGGAWARANADASTLEHGFTSAPSDAGARVTLMLGPLWVGSESDLPLLTTPIQRQFSAPTLMGMSPGII